MRCKDTIKKLILRALNQEKSMNNWQNTLYIKQFNTKSTQ